MKNEYKQIKGLFLFSSASFYHGRKRHENKTQADYSQHKVDKQCISQIIHCDNLLFFSLGALRLFVERNPHKKKSIDKQTSNNQESDINFFNKVLQINQSHSKNSSILIARIRNTIEKIALNVNTQRLPSAATINKNNPAATLIENAETTRNLGFVTNLSIENSISQ